MEVIGRQCRAVERAVIATGQHDLGDFNQDAPGTTYLGIAVNDDVTVEQVRLPGDRERVRRYSVISLLNALRLRLISS